jgi:hypothetical protein
MFEARSRMKNLVTVSLILLTGLLWSACTDTLDPLSPGNTGGNYALGIKALMPLVKGNRWTYNVVVHDTSGVEKARYTYDLSVLDTALADTGKIPLLPPSTSRKDLSRGALTWYLLRGEAGATTCWQVDSVENLRVRRSDDARFYEQVAFNFRAGIGDVSSPRYIGPDTTTWGSGDVIITGADTVQTALVSRGGDTLRTTLGSAPYFQYRLFYVKRTDVAYYYYKPGFGLFLIERFYRKSDGSTVLVRRDELVSYYFP